MPALRRVSGEERVALSGLGVEQKCRVQSAESRQRISYTEASWPHSALLTLRSAFPYRAQLKTRAGKIFRSSNVRDTRPNTRSK